MTIPADEIAPITIPGYKPGLNPYPYDPAKAQPELDKFTGTLPTNIPYWYNSGAGHDKIAQVLVAGWTKAMPKLSFKLNGIETNSYWTQCWPGQGPGALPHGLDRRLPVDRQLRLPVHDPGRPVRQLQPLQQPEVDKLFKQARSTLDQTQRFALYNQAQSLILADAPCIPVYTYRDFRVTNNKHRRVQLQLVRSDRHVGRVGQVDPRAGCPATGD